MKKIICLCLILSIMISAIPAGAAAAAAGSNAAGASPAGATPAGASPAAEQAATPSASEAAAASGSNAVGAAAKDGYTLVPALYGKTGVDVSSTFILTPPADAADTAPEKLAASLSIDGQLAPTVARKGAKDFAVTPATQFMPNSLYIFRLKRDGKADITWAFQTAKKFQVVSSYPYDRATNVPVNSGIEMTFSSEGYAPIDSHFSISPRVSGRFEYHKDTAVFVPKSLDYKTVYTVTLKAGIKLEGTNEKLPADFIFEFETEAAPDYAPPEYKEYVYFYTKYTELPSIEAPRIWLAIYSNGNGSGSSHGRALPNPKINVYKFNSADKAVEAINDISGAPSWSNFAKEEHYIDTPGNNSAGNAYGLSLAMSFDAKDNYDYDWGVLSLPDKLSQGFYLIDASLEGGRAQMVVQISDLPVQVIADDGKAILWINDISTGKASAGAKLFDPKTNKAYVADENGVVVIDRPLGANAANATDTANAADTANSADAAGDANTGELFTITALDGNTCVWLYAPDSGRYLYSDYDYYDYDYYEYDYGYYGGGYGGYGGYGSSGRADEAYWTVLQLDRTLFQRDDTVSFFGFAQERKNNAKTGDKDSKDSKDSNDNNGAGDKNNGIKTVRAVLTQGYRYGRYGARDILHEQSAPVLDGAYSGEIKLPNLDSGSYSLTIFSGDTVSGDTILGSTYFNVREYVKPPYKIELSSDKKALFADETVTFTAKAGFFEGTPVSNLDVSYRLSAGYALAADGNGQSRTDIDGKVVVSQKIVPRGDSQGEAWLDCTVEATLPEIGLTYKSMSVRAFINDIDVDTRAKRTGGSATLTAKVNSITLDRLNDGTAEHYSDYLGAPVASKPLSVDVYRVFYVKTRDKYGDYYDYIEKKTVSRYWYERREEKIDSFGMVTGKDGKAEKKFTVPNRKNESYFARITCVDGKGRKIIQEAYIGIDYSSYWRRANSNEYYLDGAKDSYGIGDKVSLTVKRGTGKVTRGNFLFVSLQRGIQGWQAGKNPYSAKFAKENVPNATVNAYYFNGFNYQSGYSMRADIRFDYSKNDLALAAALDKETYKPGDTCRLVITAKDKKGNAKEADINISAVDEALFALDDYSVDTLAALYRPVSAGLKFASATHRMYVPSAGMEGAAAKAGGGGGGSGRASADMMAAPENAYESEAADSGGGSGGGETYLREVFKDTAIFGAVKTDAHGKAVYTFKLPDNITSWRLTLSGISGDLCAGNSTQNINVTNPMFLSYTLNDEFLAGDAPVIGVNVYGTSLSGKESVNFEVWDEKRPDAKYKAGGVAFERVNIPLWEMKGADEGANSLIVKATLSNGMSDAVKHRYHVLRTYREIDSAVYYDSLAANMQFAAGSGGLTNIIFTDKGRGAFLCQLLGLRYVYGDRIEKLLVRREAGRLLAKYFPDLDLYDGGGDTFDLKPYQRDDGGLAILPHAGSDLETTVRLMPYVMDELNVSTLKNYLYGIYEGDNSGNKMCALYGLAMLKEPVLLDLGNYAALFDAGSETAKGMPGLSTMDMAYVALGYCALGETGIASALYDAKIAPNLQRITPYYRVNAGVDNDDILEATSAANMLATMLEKPEREGLYEYCVKNYTTDILINVEKLAYIEHEIAKRTDAGGSITYTLFGEKYTRELKNGGSYTLRIPAQSMSEFKLTAVTGDVGAVSAYKKPMTEIGKIDSAIKITRSYHKANEFGTPGSSSSGSGKSSGGNSSDGGGSGSGSGSSSSGSGTSGAARSTNAAPSYTFEQGDLVRVQLWIDYSAKAINGSYCVTDYLPSGLEYVGNSAKIEGASSFGYGYGCYRYCTADGQKVTFYDYNGKFNKGYMYYYYARVINPGTFKAEGALVQNLNAKDSFTVGEPATVVIKR